MFERSLNIYFLFELGRVVFMRERNVFEVAHHLEDLIDESIDKVNEVVEMQEQEFEVEGKLESTLAELEKLESNDIGEIKEDLKGKENLNEQKLLRQLEKVREGTEKARSYLDAEDFDNLKEYIEKVLRPVAIINSQTGKLEDEYQIANEARNEVRKIFKLEGKRSELTEKVEMALRTIEKADEARIEKFSEKIQDEELEEDSRHLWDNTEQARNYLEDESYSDLLNYLKRVEDILDHILRDLEPHDLSNYKVDKDDPIGEGAEAKVYSIKDKKDVLLRITENGDVGELAKHKRVTNQVSDDLSIARSLEVGVFDGKAAEVVEKAPGHETHLTTRGGVKTSDYSREEEYENWSKLNSKFARAPQEHFDKLVRDTEILIKHSVNPDPQGCNLFYDEKEGFTWIDLSLYSYEGGNYTKNPNLLCLVGSVRHAAGFYPEFLDQEDQENLLKIYNKMKRAGFLGGPTEEQKEIIEAIRNDGEPTKSYI